MLKLTNESQVDKAKGTLRGAVSFADEIIRDERLRADILAAVGHGSEAGDRIRKDIEDAGITRRLAEDKKLRMKLRATLDDLESANERLRRRRSHRFRNFVLILGGVGLVAAFAPTVRRWLTDDAYEPSDAIVQTT